MLPDDYKKPASAYTYKLPEDYTLEPQHRAKLDVLVAKTGLSEQDAQAFVDLHVELTEDFVDRLRPMLRGLVVRRILFWFILMLIANIAVGIYLNS